VKKTYVPIFLGGVMQATNNRPPITIKNKDHWIDAERRRWGRHFAVPMADGLPPGFPPVTLPTMRALTALVDSHPHLVTPAFDALFRAMWVDHTPVWEKDGLRGVLATVLGSEAQAQAVLERTASKDIKDALLKRTTEAIDSGAFGLPWFVCTNAKGETQGLWGVDHLNIVAEFLDLPMEGRGLKAML
jgi:2-hydroxychromene-2-carboxylate isomerase